MSNETTQDAPPSVAPDKSNRAFIVLVLVFVTAFFAAIAAQIRAHHDDAADTIAQRLEVPLATVKTRLARGLALLRTRLDAEHGGRRESWALALAPMVLTSL